MEKQGSSVCYIPVNTDGVLKLDELERKLMERKKLASTSESIIVSIMFANNEIGTIEPIKEIAEIAHRNGAILHTDAVQAVGHVIRFCS